MSSEIQEYTIVIPKEAWIKDKKYHFIQNLITNVANVNIEDRWHVITNVENIEKYDIVFEDDTIELWDVFETLDGCEMIKLETLKEPQKDVKITLRPNV